jgi:hypothetical protein
MTLHITLDHLSRLHRNVSKSFPERDVSVVITENSVEIVIDVLPDERGADEINAVCRHAAVDLPFTVIASTRRATRTQWRVRVLPTEGM